VSAAVSTFVPLPTVGLAYGTAVALYFVLIEGCRNVLKIVAFIASSASAFLVAFFFATSLFDKLPNGSDSARIRIPATVFEGAGFVGAYLILAAGLYLFGPRSPSWWSWLRLLIWAIGGAVLGGLGATPDGTLISLLYLLWQPGVALLLGLMLATERRLSTAHHQEIAVTESSPSGLGWSKVVPGGVVLIGLFVFLGWFGIREIQSKLLVAHLNRAYQHRLAKAPPLDNLPPVEAIPPEQALIVRKIAGLQPSNPYSRASNQAGFPPTVEYDLSYDLAERLPSPSPPPVAVMVVQLPNPAWSRYRLEDWSQGHPERASIVTKFNSRAIQNTNGPVTGALRYDWTSANFLVAVCYETALPQPRKWAISALAVIQPRPGNGRAFAALQGSVSDLAEITGQYFRIAQK
jgi:hypothetical protein